MILNTKEENRRGSRLILAMLLTFLIIALVAIAILWQQAARQLVASHQRPLVEQAQRQAATHFRQKPEAIARMTFPIVLQLSDRTCVELRPIRRQDGGYLACYDTGTGQVVEESVRSWVLSD